MKLGIMQPYFFPYIGYFQLINIVDKFILYDNVAYIKNGWINRNKILIRKKANYITIPVHYASTNYYIHETQIVNFKLFKKKFIKTIILNYKKAPEFNPVLNLIETIFSSKFDYINDLNLTIIKQINKFLNINTKIILSSTININHTLKGEEKIIAICQKIKANEYINSIGGVDLYSKKNFSSQNIHLKFLKTKNIEYKQFNEKFIPNLSIIDVMMFNNPQQIDKFLNNYKIY